MKRMMMGLMAGMVMLVGATASAQDGEVQTRFYDFSDMLIDGDLLKPDGVFMNARGRQSFESLLSLERSFLPNIEEAASESALQ